MLAASHASVAAAVLWCCGVISSFWLWAAVAVWAGGAVWARVHRFLQRRRTAARCARTGFRALIVGAGMSGLAAALRCKKLGIPFTIVEKGGSIGGTWYHNRYPGAQCDVSTFVYSLSDYPQPRGGWGRFYPKQPEILKYMREVVEVHDLHPHTRLHTTVVSARWDHEYQMYHVQFQRREGSRVEEYSEAFHCVFSAPGPLHVPNIPNVLGRTSFRGAQMHTGAYDPTVKLAGKTVAVVGSAASAIQLVPAIAAEAKKVFVVQRTPNWVFPRDDYAFSGLMQWALATLPGLYRIGRWMAFNASETRFKLVFANPAGWAQKMFKWRLTRALREMFAPEVAARLVPRYAIGCKRILISDEWYQTLQRSNVELVSGEIREVTAHGLRVGAALHGAYPQPPVPAPVYGPGAAAAYDRHPIPAHTSPRGPYGDSYGTSDIHRTTPGYISPHGPSPRGYSGDRLGFADREHDRAYRTSPARRGRSPDRTVRFSPTLRDRSPIYDPAGTYLRKPSHSALDDPYASTWGGWLQESSSAVRAMLPGLGPSYPRSPPRVGGYGSGYAGRYSSVREPSPVRSPSSSSSSSLTDVVADVIVWATGFDLKASATVPFLLVGEGGVTQDQYIRHNGPEYHLGCMMPGFPNFFQLLGPNSGLGHNSVIAMAEAQLDHVETLLHHLTRMRRHSIAVKANWTGTYNDSIQFRLSQSVWSGAHGGCMSWYTDPATGKIHALWPGTCGEFQERCRADVDFAHFTVY